MAWALISISLHLTGGRSLLEDLLGPLLISLTAILAAVIAARAANKRQAAQLAHGRELQAEQLAYDREQRNRQHVRDTVDDAVQDADAAYRVMADLASRIDAGDTNRHQRRTLIDNPNVSLTFKDSAIDIHQQDIDELKSSSAAAYDSIMDLASQNIRLVLRLGEGHVVPKAHEEFRAKYIARQEVLVGKHEALLTAGDRQMMLKAFEDEARAMVAFLSACRMWFEEG
jgi:hypothetical protein